MDKSLSKELNKVLKKQKFKINTSHKVISVSRNSNTVSIEAENKKGELVTFEGDYCLISVGRSPYTEGLNLSAVGVELTKNKRIHVNEFLQTSTSNIYAIGDVIDGAINTIKNWTPNIIIENEIVHTSNPFSVLNNLLELGYKAYYCKNVIHF